MESRLGGQNYAWYSDSGMADTSSNCTATSATPTIGMRYGSTYRSVAGAKAATWAPLFPASGFYRVYVAWGAGSNRKNPITYRVNHAAGTDIFQLDQSSAANIWFQLGAGTFQFNIGAGGTVQMTNENIDVSGNMFAGPVMFEFVAPRFHGSRRLDVVLTQAPVPARPPALFPWRRPPLAFHCARCRRRAAY